MTDPDDTRKTRAVAQFQGLRQAILAAFEGLEDEGALIVRRAESLRAAYLDRVEAHRTGLAEIARSVGWTFGQHRTDHSAQAALLSLYTALTGPDRR